MMNLTDLIKALKEVQEKTEPYDTQAVVEQIEDGVVWVRIPGGDTSTPVEMTVDAKEGDTVQVRVSGGTAFLVGNATAPPTDDTVAVQAQEVAEGAAEAAERAVQEASEAATIAGNTNQYFWHTEEGTDTGAHITEIPQDEFLADPENGGGNLLARSNGIAVRDGLEEIATFSGTTVELASNSETAQILLSAQRGIMGWSANLGYVFKSKKDSSDRAILRLQADNDENNSAATAEITLIAASPGVWADTAITMAAHEIGLNADGDINLYADGGIFTTDGELVPQEATTWKAPTILNSSCTITNGGYYTEGKRVYIQMRLTLTANLAANAGINIFSGLPVPDTVNAVPLAILANNRGGHGARVTNGGRLQIIADIDHGITAGQSIDICGVYTIQ